MVSSVPKPILFTGLLVIAILVFALFRPGKSRKTEWDLGQEAFTKREFVSARSHLEKYLEQHPNSTEAHLLAAQAGRRSGHYESLEKHLEAYLALGGERNVAELERALRRSQDGDLTGAENVFKFASANPDDPLSRNMLEALARGFMVTRRTADAIRTLDLLLNHATSDEDRAEWLYWRGDMLMTLARGAEACIDLRAAITLHEDHPKARIELVKFISREEPLEAMGHLKWLDEHGHRSPEVRLELARTHRFLGETDAARKVIDELLRIRSEDPHVLTEAGALAIATNRLADAERYLRKSLSIVAQNHEALSLLGRCLQELGKDTEAKDLMDKAKQIEDELLRRQQPAKGKS